MTLTLRAGLATITAIVFGLLLAGLSVVSYQSPGSAARRRRHGTPDAIDGRPARVPALQ